MQAARQRTRSKPEDATIILCFLAVLGMFSATTALGRAEALPSAWFRNDKETYELRRLMEGRPTPELAVAEWVGPSRSMFQMKGQIVVLDFWATWCPYCIPCLRIDAKIARDYAEKRVEIIDIHDGQHPGDGAWKSVSEELGVKFSHALDLADRESSTMTRYHITAFPTYIVIDRAGVIRAAGVRPDRITNVIDRLLGEESKPVTRSEFPPEFFVGREYRPTSLKEMEAKPAPPLQADTWINDEAEIRSGGEITLIQFFSPGNRKSLDALDGLAARRSDLAEMGTRLVAVASPTSDWDAVLALAKEHAWTFPVMHDQRLMSQGGGPEVLPNNPASGEIGRTGDAYAVGPYLPSVVIDRRGMIRAAGFRWGKVSDIIRHITLHPDPTPYSASTETPTP